MAAAAGKRVVGLFPHERFQTAKPDYSCHFRHRDIKLAATPALNKDARRSEHVEVGNNLFSPSIRNISSARRYGYTHPPPPGDVMWKSLANQQGRTSSTGLKKDSKVSPSKQKQKADTCAAVLWGWACLQSPTLAAPRWSRQRFRTARPHKWRLC